MTALLNPHVKLVFGVFKFYHELDYAHFTLYSISLLCSNEDKSAF
jgi:hypothetical protein